MKTKILYSDNISKNLEKEISLLIKRKVKKLGLAVILIGENPASLKYVEIKKNKAKDLGVNFFLYKFNSETTNDNKIIEFIQKLNKDSKINGILVQLPLEKKFNTQKIIDSITFEKDVDRMSSLSIGKAYSGTLFKNSCTAQSVLNLLDYYKIDLKGKDILIIGTSIVVGKPLAALLLNRGATITLANKNTKNLEKKLKNYEIIVSATGNKHLIRRKNIKKGTILIDVGFTIENGKVYGDIDFQGVKGKAAMVSPPKGGVGPLTVLQIFLNLL